MTYYVKTPNNANPLYAVENKDKAVEMKKKEMATGKYKKVVFRKLDRKSDGMEYMLFYVKESKPNNDGYDWNNINKW